MAAKRQFEGLQLEGVRPTGKELGRGSYGEVVEVDWCNTLCAAKQLHDIFLRTLSQVELNKLMNDFEKECLTWSRLRHPNVVQFLGVFFRPKISVPVFVLEKMDTSLRHYLEANSKEKFFLPDKVSVLRQVAQGLCYLHQQNPILVHHDLTPNNILLNEYTYQTKLTDFGMTRAVDLSKLTRQSSAKGTNAFMPPEALQNPPRYTDKLDIFSFGNCVLATLIHQWPDPSHPTILKKGNLVALSEYQRRKHQIKLMDKEKAIFLGLIKRCLEDDETLRPSSADLATEVRQIQASVEKGGDNLMSTFKKSVSQLQLAKDENAQYIQAAIQLQKEIADLAEDKAQLQREISSLGEDKAQQQREISSLAEDKAQQQREKSTLAEDKAQLQREKSSLAEDKARQQREKSTLAEDKAQLQREKSSLAEDKVRQQREISTLAEDKAQLQREISTLAEDKAQLQREISTLAEDKARQQREISALAEDKAQQQREISSLAEDKAQQQREISNLAEDKAWQQREKSTLAEDKAQLQREISTLAEDKAQQQREKSSLAEDKARQQREKSTLIEDKAHQQRKISTLAEDKAQQQKEISSLAEDKAQQQREISTLTEDKAQLERYNAELLQKIQPDTQTQLDEIRPLLGRKLQEGEIWYVIHNDDTNKPCLRRSMCFYECFFIV